MNGKPNAKKMIEIMKKRIQKKEESCLLPEIDLFRKNTFKNKQTLGSVDIYNLFKPTNLLDNPGGFHSEFDDRLSELELKNYYSNKEKNKKEFIKYDFGLKSGQEILNNSNNLKNINSKKQLSKKKCNQIISSTPYYENNYDNSFISLSTIHNEESVYQDNFTTEESGSFILESTSNDNRNEARAKKKLEQKEIVNNKNEISEKSKEILKNSFNVKNETFYCNKTEISLKNFDCKYLKKRSIHKGSSTPKHGTNLDYSFSSISTISNTGIDCQRYNRTDEFGSFGMNTSKKTSCSSNEKNQNNEAVKEIDYTTKKITRNKVLKLNAVGGTPHPGFRLPFIIKQQYKEFFNKQLKNTDSTNINKYRINKLNNFFDEEDEINEENLSPEEDFFKLLEPQRVKKTLRLSKGPNGKKIRITGGMQNKEKNDAKFDELVGKAYGPINSQKDLNKKDKALRFKEKDMLNTSKKNSFKINDTEKHTGKDMLNGLLNDSLSKVSDNDAHRSISKIPYKRTNPTQKYPLQHQNKIYDLSEESDDCSKYMRYSCGVDNDSQNPEETPMQDCQADGNQLYSVRSYMNDSHEYSFRLDTTLPQTSSHTVVYVSTEPFSKEPDFLSREYL